MGYIALSGTQVLCVLIIGMALIVTFIIAFRIHLKNKKSFTSEKNNNWQSLFDRTKYPSVSVLKHSTSFFWIGVMVSMFFIISAFSWTQYERKYAIPNDAWIVEDIIDVDPPQIFPDKKLPPPPAVIEEVPDFELEEEDPVEFEDMEIEEESFFEAEPIEDNSIDDNPPIFLPKQESDEPDEIFKVVEQQPLFPGCENLSGTKDEIQACSKSKLLAFIYSRIKYPMIASENGIQGMCVVKFVVEKDGSIQRIRVIKNIGGGCGEESLRVVNLMKDMKDKWIPGRQRGIPVRVEYNLPIRFKLEN